MIWAAVILLITSFIVMLIGIIKNNNAEVKLRKANLIETKKYYEEQRLLEDLKIQQIQAKDSLAEIEKQRDDALTKFERVTQKTQREIENMKNILQLSYDAYLANLEQSYTQAEQNYINKQAQLIDNFNNRQEMLNKQLAVTEEQLNKIKSSLIAATEAQLREQEKESNLDFYKLTVDEQTLNEIKVIENIMPMLRQPVILKKLIWTTFFQKETTALCNRVLGVNKVCGIYKITNILTNQAYVGQSVDIAERWKQHIKCGLGIEASATNKLYNNMQKDKVWNFTFELLEQCPKEQLNEKEKFFINLYQTDSFGLNGTKGGS